MTELWMDAWDLASERGQAVLTTDLLLVALARQPDTAGDVLRALGAVDTALLRVIPPARGALAAQGSGWVATSPAVEQARGRAQGIALGLGVPVDSTHVLLALAYDDAGMHASALRSLGVDRGKIVERLRNAGVSVPTAAPPPDTPMQSESISLTPDEARLVVDALVARTTNGDGDLMGPSGRSRWGYGGDPDDDRRVRIYAEARVPLGSIVRGVLESDQEGR